MPFSIQVDGLGELVKNMQDLPKKAQEVGSLALYDGAGIVADAVSRAVQGIATEPFKYAAGGKKRKASPEEKAIIQSAQHGVSKFKKTVDEVRTSVGFQNAGYAELKGKRKPIPQIANAVNSGTSFMNKQPFLRRAFSQSKSAAEAAIEAGIKKHEDMLDPSR